MPPVEARTVPHHRYVHLRWGASPWLLVRVPLLAARCFGLPAVAFALAFFACFGGELAVDDGTVNARLRLPRPPWSAVDVIGPCS
jgi:hypothetical protein